VAFGFPAYHKKVLKRTDVNNFRENLEKTVDKLPFTILLKNEDQITFKVGWSIWSWGEKIIIDFSNQENVIVKSKCIFPLQCIDYGKIKRT
jgi:hypothetical protein